MAPSTAGSNFLTEAEDKLIDTLAALVKVQSWLGVGNATDAKARIYAQEIPRTIEDQDEWTADELEAIFPCVIIGPPEDAPEFELRHTADGAPAWEMIADVAFSIRFERIRPTATDNQAELRALRNAIGDVLEDIVENNGNSGTFTFSTIRPAGACYVAAIGRTEDLPIHGWKIEVACVVQEGGQ